MLIDLIIKDRFDEGKILLVVLVIVVEVNEKVLLWKIDVYFFLVVGVFYFLLFLD